MRVAVGGLKNSERGAEKSLFGHRRPPVKFRAGAAKVAPDVLLKHRRLVEGAQVMIVNRALLPEVDVVATCFQAEAIGEPVARDDIRLFELHLFGVEEDDAVVLEEVVDRTEEAELCTPEEEPVRTRLSRIPFAVGDDEVADETERRVEDVVEDRGLVEVGEADPLRVSALILREQRRSTEQESEKRAENHSPTGSASEFPDHESIPSERTPGVLGSV